MLAVLLLAQETSAPADPVAWMVNYGVAGIVIALVVLGRLRTKSEVDGLKELIEQQGADLRAERAANTALVQQLTNHTLPQMTQMAEVLDRVPVVVQKPAETGLEHTMAQIAASLARLEQGQSESAAGRSGGSA